VVQKFKVQWFKVRWQSGSELSGFSDLRDFQTAHRQWGEQALENALAIRDDCWSESIAVGSLAFESVKNELGFKGVQRNVIEGDGSYALREPSEAYGPQICR